MGVLCCHFRPKMFSPGDHVRYHSRTLGAHVLATVVGPSPNGTQFCHIRYIRPGGVTPVDHDSGQLSRLEAVAVESPKSPESPDVTPMSPQPQTPAQPTQPTMAANVPRKRSLQSTLDAFLKPNPVVTDDGSDAIVQLTGSPTQPKRPRSPTVAEDAVFVSAVKGPAKCRSKAMRLLQPLRKYREPKEKLAALDYAERTSDYQAVSDLGTTFPFALEFGAWAMCLMGNCTSLVIYVRKSGSLRIWCLRRSRWLPPRQEERLPPSQEESQLVWLCKRALKRLPNQLRAPLPPPPRPVQHTPCLSCKQSMCNNSKCVILVPRSSLPFLWILNNICVG